MIRGHLDALTAAGFVEGWAFDRETPARPVQVRVVDPEGAELALGHAHLFRADLANVNFGYGWCAFRLRLGRPVQEVAGIPVSLQAAETGEEIQPARVLKLRDGAEPIGNSLARVVAADPLVAGSIEQLRGYAPVLQDFMSRRGIPEFIRTAYLYVLGRPADEDGIRSYAPLLGIGALTPFGLLAVLAASEEFRARPRALLAPNTPAFVFGIHD
ncbi:DUF4214 domain-containing protein [Roseomonas sp. SSH11]|uniref:DUF4214 domain-containing protein n=1 Tax=Pararoseomonas baculiformis TaxID=2820812 RepID=A0ABS4AC23_9PROT|nr:DUF4214 domain-containing protein [Pararoseomonas baculiformis]MBP0444526.1 DUF4214 domain-containing protein [Pararoseomonas baculiformis]